MTSMTTDEPHANKGEQSNLSTNDQLHVGDERRRAAREWLQETEAFTQEVARRRPSSVSSVDLIREQRREL